MAKRWYSVSVLSNFEKKIAEQIKHAVAEKGLEIYNALLDLASGTPSSSESLGYGRNEFQPWHIGVVM